MRVFKQPMIGPHGSGYVSLHQLVILLAHDYICSRASGQGPMVSVVEKQSIDAIFS